MAGLLGSMLAGGVKGYADGRANDIRKQEDFNLKMELQNAAMEKELKLKQAGIDMQTTADIAKENRVRETNASDMKKINQSSEQSLATDALSGLGTAGVGGSVDAESLQALKDNPAALEAYRKAGATGLLNSTRQQDAEAKSNAAINIGRADIADKYENVAKGERADAKEEARQQESNRRLDNQEKAADQRFKAQMASQEMQFKKQLDAASRAETNALKREDRADVRSKVTALSESLKAYQDTGEKASLQLSKPEVMDNPELSAHYTKIANESMSRAKEVAARLENYATTGNFEIKQTKPNTDNPLGLPDDLLKGAKPKAQVDKSSSKPVTNKATQVQEKPNWWEGGDNNLKPLEGKLNLGNYSR